MTPVTRGRALFGTELTLQIRHGTLPALGVTSAVWVVVLLALPGSWRAGVLPWLLFLEVSAAGFLLLPALTVVERGNGVTAALGLTRLHPGTALAVRLVVLGTGALVPAFALAVIAGVRPSPVLLAVTLTTLLLSLVAIVTIGRADDLTVLVARAPLVALPLLGPALLERTGLLASPLLAVSPATGAFRLLAGQASIAAVVWIMVWCVGLWVAAVRIGFDVSPPQLATGRRRRRRVSAAGGSRTGRTAAVRSFAAVDRRVLLGDRLLLMLLAGVPLIAGALRWMNGPGSVWLEQRYAVEVGAHLPAISAFVLVLHIPVMVGSLVGLLFLEDRDAGLLPAIAVTPASLVTLVGYRLGATVVAAGLAVAGASWVAGVSHAAGGAGVAATAVAAGAVATVPAVAMATLAGDRAQGVALMKILTLPLYVPVAWWFVDGPVGWLFALIPTAWAARTFWTTDLPGTLGAAAAAVAISAVVAATVGRQLLRAPESP